MKERTRALTVSILILSVIALPSSHTVAEDIPVDVSGTWVSRVPGQGLNETTVPHLSGYFISTFYEVELELNQSGAKVIGELDLQNEDAWIVNSVNGTVSGSEFTMAYFHMYISDAGYVRNVTGVIDFEIDGDAMLGEGLLYVGAPIFPDLIWKFDLVRDGEHDEGEHDIAPLAAVIVAAIAAAALAVMLYRSRFGRQ